MRYFVIPAVSSKKTRRYLFFLDGKWVLIIGFINSDPVSDIQRDVKYMIGTFDGEKFIPESSGLLDYGKDFYAVQSAEIGRAS